MSAQFDRSSITSREDKWVVSRRKSNQNITGVQSKQPDVIPDKCQANHPSIIVYEISKTEFCLNIILNSDFISFQMSYIYFWKIMNKQWTLYVSPNFLNTRFDYWMKNKHLAWGMNVFRNWLLFYVKNAYWIYNTKWLKNEI